MCACVCVYVCVYACVRVRVCMYVCYVHAMYAMYPQTQVDAPSLDTLADVATQSAPDINKKVIDGTCLYA